MSRTVVIWDIDGTLANNSHRAMGLVKRCMECGYEPLPQRHRTECPDCGSTESTVTQESWDTFLNPEQMKYDAPIIDAIDVLKRFREMEAEIHFLTGRSEEAREVTEAWLKKHAGKTLNESLNMRQLRDEGLPASEYKARAFSRLKNYIGSDGVFIFFEDDPHVFPIYDDHGLVVQCPDGIRHFMPPRPIFSESNKRP